MVGLASHQPRFPDLTPMEVHLKLPDLLDHSSRLYSTHHQVLTETIWGTSIELGTFPSFYFTGDTY